MAFCKNCGAEIHEEAVICPQCGTAQEKATAVNDSGSLGWTALGCCVPVAGLVLFILWKDTQPNNAKKAGLGALLSVIAAVLFFILYFLFIFVLVFAIGMS
ncbi:MAG: zinc-ribbon domain-containing protein [Clostridia bacterium]|nr:zinc-ribbon domain-containing protein [Clostridia bacterium]